MPPTWRRRTGCTSRRSPTTLDASRRSCNGSRAPSSAGDTSCIADYAPIRAVDSFARSVRDLDGSARTRTAVAAANTVADVAARWWEMWAYTGSGLRGGTFSTWGWNQVGWNLDRVRWVKDLWVSGRASWSRRTGEVTADMRVGGDGSIPGISG